jgi:glycosyltransferase involved in cell wall biosynthesis
VKILLVSASYPSEPNKHTFGFVHARAKLYKKYGHSVYALVPLYGSKHEDSSTYVYEGIRVFKVNASYMSDIVENIDPDVIAYHFPEQKILKSLLLMKRPLVLWIHGADVLMTFLHNYYIPFYMKSLLRGLLSIPLDIRRNISLRNIILMEKNIQMVTPSIWMKRMVLRYLAIPESAHDRIHVIPNPVDTNRFRPIKSCYERQRNIGISVRALDYKYGVDIAVKSMCGLKGIKLVLVGNGPLRGYLTNIAEKCKAEVEFIHQGIAHEELPRYYNDVGFFLAPSRTEAQGVAMCEALACGTPAIATSVDGIPEFVIHGYNGILAKPDPEALQKAIDTLIKMPVEDYCIMAQNAASYARKKYSHEVVIPRELALLLEAIELYNKQSTMKI